MAYWSTGPASIGAAGRQVRNTYRLSAVRAASVPDLTRNVGICSSSATGETGAPTPLERMPPTATTPSSTSRSNPVTPTSGSFSSSCWTISIIRPSTPPAALISSAASSIPSRTLTPHAVKVTDRSASIPILIGSPDGAAVVEGAAAVVLGEATVVVGSTAPVVLVPASSAQAATTKAITATSPSNMVLERFFIHPPRVLILCGCGLYRRSMSRIGLARLKAANETVGHRYARRTSGR